jgi:subtilisin family serine protease
MRLHLSACSALVFACGTVASDRVAQNAAVSFGPAVVATDSYADDHILVWLNPGIVPDGPTVDDGVIDTLARAWGVSSIEPLYPFPFAYPDAAARHGLDRVYRFEVAAGTDTAAMAAAFATVDGVEKAHVDGLGGVADTHPNDPFYQDGTLWNMHNTGQGGATPDADVDGPEAWDLHTGDGSVIVAVCDTGIRSTHSDLAGKVTAGWDFYNNNGNTEDFFGHGSHVAGTIGAWGDNNLGVVGVNWNVEFIAIQVVSDSGFGDSSMCANGIIYGVDNGADFVSMSLQYYTDDGNLLRDAVNYARDNDVLPIAATGNSQGRRVAFPAKHPGCMGVGATTKWDTWATFSNYGPEISVSAPGQDVWSCWIPNTYTFSSGTSMATPHVSGLASLIKSYNPQLTADEIEQIIVDSVDDLPPAGFDEKFGWGRINVRTALDMAITPCPPDLNGDDRVDSKDFVLFLNAFTAGDSLADYNADGIVNSLDFTAYLNDFVAGC